MNSLKISSEDFEAWKKTTGDAMRILERIGNPPSGDYGGASGTVEGEHGIWSSKMTTTHTELNSLKDAIELVQKNMKTADQIGSNK